MPVDHPISMEYTTSRDRTLIVSMASNGTTGKVQHIH